MKLEGYVSLVTGAGSGIGRAIANALAAEGSAIAAVDWDLGRAEETVRSLTENGVSAIAVKADVSNSIDVTHAIEKVTESFPSVNVLVNCAGMGKLGTVLELSEEDWDTVMATNVKSIFLFSREVIPLMPSTPGGRIINIASVSGLVASAGRAAYTASKGAVVMLTRAMALDHADAGIRVNAICPGVTETAMTAESLSDPSIRQEKLDKTPLRWLAQPEDIAPAAVYLASDDSSFVTGSSMVIDGGWTA